MTDNHTQLKLVLTTLATFTENELEAICSKFLPEQFKKGDIILNAGTVCDYFYYIKNGVIRTYFLDASGSEKTRLLMPTCSIGTAFSSFISRKPSVEFIDCVESCDVFMISYDDFFSLLSQFESWNKFYIRILEMAYIFQNKRIEDLVTLNADERFDKFQNDNPRLLQEVSGKIIASYLDMTPETFSRIRSRRN